MEEAAATLEINQTDRISNHTPDLDPQPRVPMNPAAVTENQFESGRDLQLHFSFASLRFALSEATSTSVDHMQCLAMLLLVFKNPVNRTGLLDAATKGNRYINSCMRLNEEMKDIGNLATQLKILRRNVDVLDSAVTKLLRFP
ncbi:BLOC-1-related complex [Salix suchowensis]|nr:BLOC-1-related complex [Salix suchowensis]